MFRIFSTGLFLLQGTLFTLVNTMNLMDFRAAVQGASAIVEELEAITSTSNTGAYCVAGRLEHCFLLLSGLLLVAVALSVPAQNRAWLALSVALGEATAVYSEYAISTNTFAVQVYQGDYAQLMGIFAYVNGVFASLFFLVGFGTLAGLAKPTEANGDTKKTA